VLKDVGKGSITCQTRSVVHAILLRKGSGSHVLLALHVCGTVHRTTTVESSPRFCALHWL
jgi:hypothetical protein